jgi:hypothetical protein
VIEGLDLIQYILGLEINCAGDKEMQIQHRMNKGKRIEIGDLT